MVDCHILDTSSLIPMKVNEVRSADLQDFQQFQQFVISEDGWQQRYNKHGTKVFTKLSDDSPLKVIKVVSDLKETSVEAVFDTLNDPDYRKKWDEHMIESQDICKLDCFNDIGYYAVKLPRPLKNRDFLLQRSWTRTKSQFMMFSHSVQHRSMPLRREFMRASCIVSGYIGESDGDCGCRLTYVSQVDPRGRLPKWLVNRVSTRVAPKETPGAWMPGVHPRRTTTVSTFQRQLNPLVVEKLRKAALNYAAWKNKNSPDWKPWINPEQNQLPDLDTNDIAIDNSREFLSEVIDESGVEE